MSEDQVQVASAVLLEMDQQFPIVMPLELGERQVVNGKKETVVIGTVSVLYPTLESFGINAEHDVEGEAKRTPGDKFPQYKDVRYQWLYSAIQQKVAAFARSKTENGKLKDGMTIAENFSDLTEIGERGGAHLKNRADCLKSFQGYFATLESVPKAPVISMYVSFLNSPESLLGASDKAFESFKSHLAAWGEKISEEDGARFSKTVAKAVEMIELKAEM